MNAPQKNGRQLAPGQLLMTAGLLVLVVISALAVVASTHRSRERFNHLQVLQRQEWALDEEWERLLLEQSTWAAHERVNQIAESRLDMVMPDPAVIRVIPATPSGGGR
jgi:cell division protein FtsL